MTTRFRRLLVGSCLSLSCIGYSALAADWHQFRGPSGDGHSLIADLPLEWSDSEHIKWRAELPGSGWSSPVVVGKQVYLTAAIPIEGSETGDLDLALLIIDVDSGKVTKRVSLFTQSGKTAPKIHSKNSHASPTALVVGDRVYLHFGHQGTAATTLDGEIVWRNDSLPYPPVHGNGGSPVLVGDKLIFSEDGGDRAEVIALDAKTGKLAWQTKRDVEAGKKFSFCTPLVIESSGKKQVIFPGSNVVQALDTETGEEIWRVRYEGYSVIPRPVIAAGLILVCTGYDAPQMIAIRPSGKGDVTDTHVAWTSKENIPHTPSLLVHNDLVYMVNDKGIASCLDPVTGKQVWRERIGGNFSASPLLAGDKIYVLSEEGVTTVFKADKQFTKLAENKLGERTLASMAVVDRDILIRTAKSLVRITK